MDIDSLEQFDAMVRPDAVVFTLYGSAGPSEGDVLTRLRLLVRCGWTRRTQVVASRSGIRIDREPVPWQCIEGVDSHDRRLVVRTTAGDVTIRGDAHDRASLLRLARWLDTETRRRRGLASTVQLPGTGLDALLHRARRAA